MGLSLSLPQGLSVIQRGWLSSNMVLAADADSLTIIDTGYASHAAQTVALVESAVLAHPCGDGMALRVINTHLHSDHCGGNSALRQRWPHLRIGIPPGSASAVEAWDHSQLTYAVTGQRCPPFSADFVVRPGEHLQLAGHEWHVLAAPGHDPHAVVLFEPVSGTLISADALWEHGFGVVFPELEGEPGFELVEDTLDLIAGLNPRCVIPGHGAPFTDVSTALGTARSRLAAFRSSPTRHAVHAAKVLLVFRLLEAVSMSRDDLAQWARSTPYLQTIHRRLAAHLPFDGWIAHILQQLLDTGAVASNGHHLCAART